MTSNATGTLSAANIITKEAITSVLTLPKSAAALAQVTVSTAASVTKDLTAPLPGREQGRAASPALSSKSDSMRSDASGGDDDMYSAFASNAMYCNTTRATCMNPIASPPEKSWKAASGRLKTVRALTAMNRWEARSEEEDLADRAYAASMAQSSGPRAASFSAAPSAAMPFVDTATDSNEPTAVTTRPSTHELTSGSSGTSKRESKRKSSSKRNTEESQIEAELLSGRLKPADRTIAYAANLMHRCVKKRVTPRGHFVDPSGVRVNIERCPWFSPIRDLAEYGCPIAVYLYLRFLVEGTLLFVAMGLVAAPLTYDLVLRNLERDDCRAAAMRDPADRTSADRATLGRCGFEGLDIRTVLPQLDQKASSLVQDHLLLAGTGSCEEYRNSPDNFTTTQIIATPSFSPFVRIRSNASFCLEGESGLVSHDGTLLLVATFVLVGMLFTAFLVRLRRMQVVASGNFKEQGAITPSRYAVLITGLDKVEYDDSKGVPSMEKRLRTDLARHGFNEADIQHIELGRDCGRELAQLRRLAEVKAQRQEFIFSLYRQQQNQEVASKQVAVEVVVPAPTRLGTVLKPLRRLLRLDKKAKDLEQIKRTRDDLHACSKELEKARAKLRALSHETHRTTGHAFVIFSLEATRDRFLDLFTHELPSFGKDTPHDILVDVMRHSPTPLGPRFRFGECGNLGGVGPPLQSASWRHVHVERAPEPSDVMWENLEIDEPTRRCRHIVHTLLGVLLLVLATTSLYTTRLLQIAHAQFAADGNQDDISSKVPGFVVSTLNSVVTLVFNLIINFAIDKLTHREAHPTRSEFERHKFTRLSFFYLVNTLVVPIFVSMFTLYDPKDRNIVFFITGITQASFEGGGLVAQAYVLIISTSAAADFARYVDVPALIRRHVYGYFAERHGSQIKLNELYRPSTMQIGQIYAETFRLVAIGLCYAPLYPPSLLLTACCLFSSIYATKYGIAKWYRTPPLIGGDLMKRMRNTLSLLLLLYIAIGVFVAVERYSYLDEASPRLLGLGLLWLFLMALGPLFSRVRQCSTRLSARKGTVNTLRFDEVTRATGVIMEKYICPSASRARSAAQLEEDAFRVGFRGVFADAGKAEVLEPTESEQTSSDADESDAAALAAYFASIAERAEERAKKARHLPSTGKVDPVLGHLDGALEAINAAMSRAGGKSELSHALCISVEQQPLPSPRFELPVGGADDDEVDPIGWPKLKL
jgi:hypothetical protein